MKRTDMKKRIYQEIATDNGAEKKVYASDNYAAYILTSAYAKDLYVEYVQKWDRQPSARWYNRHFAFERIR